MLKKMVTTIMVIGFLLVIGASFSQAASEDEINSKISEYMTRATKNGFSGVPGYSTSS